jgi:hypothetical protein
MLNELQLGEFIYEQPAVGDTGYVFKHIRHGVFSWRGPFAGQDSLRWSRSTVDWTPAMYQPKRRCFKSVVVPHPALLLIGRDSDTLELAEIQSADSAMPADRDRPRLSRLIDHAPDRSSDPRLCVGSAFPSGNRDLRVSEKGVSCGLVIFRF